MLATFYIARKEKEVTKRLWNLIYRGLKRAPERAHDSKAQIPNEVREIHWKLEESSQGDPSDFTQDRTEKWHAPDGQEVHLLRFHPQATRDTTVLQVALNSPGDAATDWDSSRQKLESILEPEDLDGIWGYTLTYQAKLNLGIGADEAFEKLRYYVHHLHSDRQAPYKPLARAHVEGGWVWLMAVPTEGKGPEAATVYVALSEPEEGSEPEKERALGRVFFGKGARFLMPELIAHKSYYQRRQYRGEKYEEYRGYLDEFREHVRTLLRGFRKRKVETEVLSEEELRTLTQHYHGLADIIWQLEDVRVSMAQQLHNYDEWEITGDNDVLQYHRRHIETTNVELELLVSEGRYALGAADPVISMSRYRAEKARDKVEARNQGLILIVLGVVGAALTLPELIDKELAGCVIAWIPWLESFEGNTFVEFLVQLALIVILAIPVVILLSSVVTLAILIWLGARRWLDKRRQSHDSSEEAEIHAPEGEQNSSL